MDIKVFSSQELPAVFHVLRTALNSEGPLETRERLFLETYARITGYRLPADDLHPVTPESVRIEGAHQRKRLVQLSALAVLLNNPLRPASVAFLRELSEQLGAHDSVVDVVEAVHKGRRLKARMLAARRAFRVMFKEAYLHEGVPGVLRFFAAMALKAPVNRDKLWSYKRLGLLPSGTLGREYWKHLTSVGFGFPGEPGGIPDSVAYHDIGHVLTEYETDPAGEIQQGAFQAGNRREDGFFFVQFVVLQFHHGIKITPVAPPETGMFDPEKVLWAIHRGATCNVDITHQWNFWPLMPLSLHDARAQINLLPRLATPVVHRRAA
jgi:hypothetical protein